MNDKQTFAEIQEQESSLIDELQKAHQKGDFSTVDDLEVELSQLRTKYYKMLQDSRESESYQDE